jgi:hypothetical protein
MNGSGAPGALASTGLFTQTISNGAAAANAQKTASSVGYPPSGATGNLLNYNYGGAQNIVITNAPGEAQSSSGNFSGATGLGSADSQAAHQLNF